MAFVLLFTSLQQSPQEYRSGIVDVSTGLSRKEVICWLKAVRGVFSFGFFIRGYL